MKKIVSIACVAMLDSAAAHAGDQSAPQDVAPRRVRERMEDAIDFCVTEFDMYNHLVVR